VKTVWR